MPGSLDSCITGVYEDGNIQASSGIPPVRVTVISEPVGIPLGINGTPVTTGDEDEVYAGFTVSGIGGTPPYTYSVASGTLPAGITLDSSTGAVSGTPTTAGTYAGIVIRVTDDISDTADLAAFTITIGAPAALAKSAMVEGVFVNSDGTPRQANADGVMVNL